MEDRKTYIELLRIIASFLVIVNHTNSYVFLSAAPSVTWFASVTWFFVSKAAVPVFLMISGALLLPKQDTPRRSLSRFARILAVFFFCSAACYIYYNWDALDGNSLPDFFSVFFAGQGVTNAYWYFYLYLGLLLTLPLLQRAAAALSEKHLRWLLLLSPGLLGLLPLIRLITGYPFGFFWTDSFFSVAIGLLFAGLYVERCMKLTRRHFWCAAALFAGLIAVQVGATYLLYRRDPVYYLQLDDRWALTITAGAFCLFVMVKYLVSSVRLSPAAQKRVGALGALTFGIYLFSDPAIHATRGLYELLSLKINPFLAALAWELLVFALSALSAAALRLIPPLRKFL